MTQGETKHLHKDHFAGGLMMLLGLATIYFGHDLRVGSLMRMGPGYFPMALGIILTLLGAAIAVGAKREDVPPMMGDVSGDPSDLLAATRKINSGKPEWRGWGCIVGSFVAFILLLRYAGMLPATTAITIIAAFGARGNSWKTALMLAVAMNVIVVVVFWYFLQMPFRLFWWN